MLSKIAAEALARAANSEGRPIKVSWPVRARLVSADLAAPRDDMSPGYWIEITAAGRAFCKVKRL